MQPIKWALIQFFLPFATNAVILCYRTLNTQGGRGTELANQLRGSDAAVCQELREQGELKSTIKLLGKKKQMLSLEHGSMEHGPTDRLTGQTGS